MESRAAASVDASVATKKYSTMMTNNNHSSSRKCPMCKEDSLVLITSVEVPIRVVGKREEVQQYCNKCETYFSKSYRAVAKVHPNVGCSRCCNNEWILEYTTYNDKAYYDRVCSKCLCPLPIDLERNKNESNGMDILPTKCLQCDNESIEIITRESTYLSGCDRCYCMIDISRYIRNNKQLTMEMIDVSYVRCCDDQRLVAHSLWLVDKMFIVPKCSVCGTIRDNEYNRQCTLKDACVRCGNKLMEEDEDHKTCTNCKIRFNGNAIVAWNDIVRCPRCDIGTSNNDWLLCIMFVDSTNENISQPAANDDPLAYLQQMSRSRTTYWMYRSCIRCGCTHSADIDFVSRRRYDRTIIRCPRCDSLNAAFGIHNNTMCVQCFECKHVTFVNHTDVLLRISEKDKCNACQQSNWKRSVVPCHGIVTKRLEFRWCYVCKQVDSRDAQLLARKGIDRQLYSAGKCEHCGNTYGIGECNRCTKNQCYICTGCEDSRCPKERTTSMFRYKNQDTKQSLSRMYSNEESINRDLAERYRKAAILEAEEKLTNMRRECDMIQKQHAELVRVLKENELRVKEAQTLATIKATEEAKYQLLKQPIETQKPRTVDDECVICMSNKRNTTLLECGHVAVCHTCAESCVNKPCPICRATVVRYIKIFIV